MYNGKVKSVQYKDIIEFSLITINGKLNNFLEVLVNIKFLIISHHQKKNFFVMYISSKCQQTCFRLSSRDSEERKE